VQLIFISFSDLIADFFTLEDLVESFLVFFVEDVDEIALRALDWVGVLIGR
jgi:hypothetical protein